MSVENRKRRTSAKVALALVQASMDHDESDVIIGNVTAGELAAFVFAAAGICPKCGVPQYADKECEVCCSVQAIVRRNLKLLNIHIGSEA